MRPLRESLEDSSGARPEWESYSPADAFAKETEEKAHDQEIERLRDDLDSAHAEAVEEARGKPPPKTVEAYKNVFGRFPKGWPL